MVDLNKLLAAALMLIGEYRRGRDAVVSAGDPTVGGDLLTDDQLIARLRADADAQVAHIDQLLAKHRTTSLDD